MRISGSSYFSSFGDRLEPWTATWQVVQFRQRGRSRLWVAGGCEPSALAASVEWHSRQRRSIRERVSCFGLFEPCGSWHVRQPPVMPAVVGPTCS